MKKVTLRIVSFAVILSFVFSNVSFVFAGSNLRTMSSAETETVSGLRKDLWSGGLPAKSPAAAVTKVTAPTTKFDSILATAIPELREAARIILDDSGVQLFNPSVYMEEEGAQIRIAISDPTDSFNEAGFIISKGIQYIGYRISPFHGSYEYAGGTTLDYNKFIELVKEVLKKEKEHPYWGEWTTAVTDKRMRATKPAPVKEFATTGLTGKTPTGVGPAMGMGSEPNRVSNTIADLNRALEDGVVHVVSDSYRAEKVEDAIKELRKIALHSATSLQDLARIAEAIKQTQNRFETYALGYEEYLRTHREAFSPDAQRQEYDRLWKSDQRDEAERYLAEVNAAPKDSRGWYIYKTCVSALAEIEPRLITLAKSTQTSAEDFPHERPSPTASGVGPAMGDGGTPASPKEIQPGFNPLYNVFSTIFQGVFPEDRSRDDEARFKRYIIMVDQVASELEQTVEGIKPYIKILEEWGLIEVVTNPYREPPSEPYGEGFPVSTIQLTTAASINKYKDPILLILKGLPSAPLAPAEQEKVGKQIAQILGTVPPTPAEKEAAKQEFTEPTRFDIAQAEQPTSAEKQAARDKLISIANAVDTGVLSSEIKAEKIFTDFGIAKEGKSGLILSIDAVAEGPGAALIGLAKRGVRVILYEDGTKRSQALINIRKELNQQIKDPQNQISMAFSLEGALELLSQERIDHITYIGTEEEINQLTEEVKKRMNVIKTVKEIIEALGQIENMSRMLDDFKSACVRLGLV